jgi:hypothetical protein
LQCFSDGCSRHAQLLGELDIAEAMSEKMPSAIAAPMRA